MNNLLISTASPVTLRVPDFKRVFITLVGCGGTGSHIASGLVSITQALQAENVSVDMLFVDPDNTRQIAIIESEARERAHIDDQISGYILRTPKWLRRLLQICRKITSLKYIRGVLENAYWKSSSVSVMLKNDIEF